MAKRRKLTRRQKAEIFQAQNGQCIDCGTKLSVGEVEWDHRKERRMAVDEEDAKAREDLSNFAGICPTCHLAKTAEWAGIHAKAERQGGRTGQQARRAAGKTQAIPSGPMPGTKASGWKRKFDGTVERRN
ncbi:HNH endonuclease [Maricaulis sp.]|jgi:5-methylcytosine-specific restriction endonuclease McrA|uniref:HNH endonuclease n=1 Tax=Maricaulis sp. TaxID=1486257 RepID=UPI002603A1AB|nr:HNH endonuclease [Maricaulis sp.]MDF1769858.1 HNH endonuclease [Maricaulis sp.]